MTSVPDARVQAAPLRMGVLSGSPRRGNCARLADAVVTPALHAAGGGRLGVEGRELRAYAVAPCRGCGACERTGTCVLAPAEQAAGGAPGFLELLAWLDSLDALVLVAPAYFAGPPAQLKAALDRLQFLWARRYALATWPALEKGRRRPLGIVALGGGGDPFGLEPLVTCCRSALRMADFELVAQTSLAGYRSGAPDAARDEGLEREGATFARTFARECLRRGPFCRRGAIDPLASPGRR